MQAYEFQVETSEKGEVIFPQQFQQVLKERKKARVILLVDDEEANWNRLTSEAFFSGYSEKDAAYDNL
jgi:hypothetical protein